MSQAPTSSPHRRLPPGQMRALAIGGVVLAIVIGIATFVLLFWAMGGFATSEQETKSAPEAIAEAPLAAPAPAVEVQPPQKPAAQLAVDAVEEAEMPVSEPTTQESAAEAETPAQVETGVGEAAAVPTTVALPSITQFSLGGQAIHGGLLGIDVMKQAGMTWVKLQAFDITKDWSPDIQNAHQHGLRILISVKDEPNKDRVTSPDYQQQLLQFFTTVASQGADAIEVWNEPNLAREWPAGKLSGASYTELLEKAYTQIKATSPNTLVVSAALSPTGAFGGGCGRTGCDDKPYLEEMVVAGALNYLDCIGIHYNEGLLPPSATSGDPRGNSEHYTRYFQGMLDTYLTATGGAKPLCFTELGYLSGEEWGFLPQQFLWNPPINMTVAQQSDYLGQVVRLARQNGNIRMVIVFNVDFAVLKPDLSGDPQAGYSIIRPDGSCPACATLAAAMR